MKRITAEEVEREIDALDTLDLAALRKRWRDLYKIDAPPKIRSGFLKRAIAYRLQELVYGGLKPAALRQLKMYAEHARGRRGTLPSGPHVQNGNPIAVRTRITLSAGTRLMREWNGMTQVVEVTPDGFVWRGNSYKTLSAVAVAITGTKWSGPKFFGLGGRPGGVTKTSERSPSGTVSASPTGIVP